MWEHSKREKEYDGNSINLHCIKAKLLLEVLQKNIQNQKKNSANEIVSNNMWFIFRYFLQTYFYLNYRRKKIRKCNIVTLGFQFNYLIPYLLKLDFIFPINTKLSHDFFSAFHPSKLLKNDNQSFVWSVTFLKVAYNDAIVLVSF